MTNRFRGDGEARCSEEQGPTHRAASMQRWWSLVGTIGLLALLASLIDWRKLAGETQRISLLAMVLGTALLTLQPLLGSVRLWAMMRSAGTARGFGTVARIYVIALLSNLVILNFVGAAVVRIFLMRRVDVPVLTSSAILAVEKLVILATLLVLGLITAPLLPPIRNLVLERELLMLGLILMAATCVLVAAVWVASWVLPWDRMRKALQLTWDEIRTLGLDPLGWSIIVLTTLASLGALFAAYFVVAESLAINVPLLQLIAVLPIVTLIASLPLSLGGWGLREATLAVMLSTYGVPLEQAVLLSGLVAALSILAALLSGIGVGLISGR